MRVLAALSCLIFVMFSTGCDFRSETAKREMEKFSGTPTPTFSPVPTEPPVNPADIIQADPTLEGENLSVFGYDQKKTVECTKLNQVYINGGKNVVTIKGACGKIMINGDDNQITSDAALEIVINGVKNTFKYSKFVNGKRPLIKDNGRDNTIDSPGVSL